MRIEDIQRMAHDILEKGSIENDYIEYKKSATFKDKILKTICAFANNYMNREIGLLFIGIEEVNDPKTGEKAIPKRPIYGIEESLIESTENSLKQLLANIYPKVSYHLITDVVDDRNYIIVAVEPGTSGPYQTSDKAESDKDISLKAGRYIRVKRDSRLPNFKEEYELLRKFAHDVFSSNLNETATLDDLSYEYMKEYLISTNAREDIRNQSKLDMAKSMGLISESEYGGYRAKNFAVLMFTEKPDKFIPYAHVEIIREAIGTDKMEAKIFDGPIWIQAKQVSRYFKDNIMASYTVRDSETIEHRIVYNWPLTVFEELATNCILHKQYESPNYIGIYIYNDRITFVNHNRPVPPVTIEAMNKEGRPFKGCLYFGLMITPNGPKVIEYNARFGDPEAQVVLPRLKTDLVDICEAVIDEKLSDLDIEWDNGAAACVVMASGGYPVSYKKGIEMFGLNDNLMRHSKRHMPQ